MQFNSHADSQDIVSSVLDKAGATSVNVYSLKRIARNFNAALDMYFSWAFEADNRWNFDDINETSPPIDTQAIVSGTNRYKIGTFTEKVINVIRIEILSSAAKGLYVQPETLSNLGNVVNQGNESGRLENTAQDTFKSLYVDAPSGTPTHYIKYGDFIYLRPNPNYSETDGLQIYFNRSATYIVSTNTTTVPGTPVIHHPLLCELAANEYKYDKKMMTLAEKLAFQNYAKDIVMDYFSNRDEDIPRRMKPRYQDNK